MTSAGILPTDPFKSIPNKILRALKTGQEVFDLRILIKAWLSFVSLSMTFKSVIPLSKTKPTCHCQSNQCSSFNQTSPSQPFPPVKDTHLVRPL